MENLRNAGYIKNITTSSSAFYRIRVARLPGKIFNNALCFSLHLLIFSFVFMTALITVWPDYPGILATLYPIQLGVPEKSVLSIFSNFPIVII